MNGKEYSKTCFYSVATLLLTLVLYGGGCGTTTYNSIITTTNTQEFLKQDIEIDWSQVHLVEPEATTRFGALAFVLVNRFEGNVRVLGAFDQGLPVTLINQGGYPICNGTTGPQETINSFCESQGGDYSLTYTNTDIPISLLTTQSTVLGIVGELADYEVLPLWPSWDYTYAIAQAASAIVHSQPSLFERCGNPEVFRFSDGERDGVMVCFEETGLSKQTLRNYILIIGQIAFEVDVICGSTPILFRANGELYLTAMYRGDACGNVGQYILNLREDGKMCNYNWGM